MSKIFGYVVRKKLALIYSRCYRQWCIYNIDCNQLNTKVFCFIKRWLAMRNFGRFWLMGMCLLLVVASCNDNKLIEKARKARQEQERIEEQKRQEEEAERKKREEEERKKKEENEQKKKEEEEKRKKEEDAQKEKEEAERKKKEEEERKKREEEEKRKEEERKKKEEEERKKREEEEKRKEEERKKKEEEEKQKEAERQSLTGVYAGTRTFKDGEKNEEIFNVVFGKDGEGKEYLSFAYPNGKATTYLSSKENDKITFYYQSYDYDRYKTITCILIPSTRSLKIVYTYSYDWTFEGTKQ